MNSQLRFKERRRFWEEWVKKMQKPNLDRMWETFIKIPKLTDLIEQCQQNQTRDNLIQLRACLSDMIDIIRRDIYSTLVSDPNIGQMIDWYSFLIHDRKSGVPTTLDDKNAYFHIRVTLKHDVKPKDFENALPDYCVMTRPAPLDSTKSIGINETTIFDTSSLKSEQIEDVWKIIGEQSEWFLNALLAHKEDKNIPFWHILAFLHYFDNMVCRFGLMNTVAIQ